MNINEITSKIKNKLQDKKLKIYSAEEIANCFIVNNDWIRSTRTLNNCLFLAQGLSLAIFERPLFLEPIQIKFLEFDQESFYPYDYEIKIDNCKINNVDYIRESLSNEDRKKYSQLIKNDTALSIAIYNAEYLCKENDIVRIHNFIKQLSVFKKIKELNHKVYFFPLEELKLDFKKYFNVDSTINNLDEIHYLNVMVHYYPINLQEYDNFYKQKYIKINNRIRKIAKIKKLISNSINYIALYIVILYLIFFILGLFL